MMITIAIGMPVFVFTHIYYFSIDDIQSNSSNVLSWACIISKNIVLISEELKLGN